jgi:hypothetical protein
MTLDELRVDFIARRRGSLALPITGVMVYTAIAIATLLVSPERRNWALAIGFWAIPPLGALVMRVRDEEPASPDNPLFDLSAKARIMALSTWAIHIPIWLYAPALLPISVGIGFALHWVVFAWTVRHPVGFYHLGARIVLVLAAWHLWPANRVGAVSAGVALAYALSAWQLRRIRWTRRFEGLRPRAASPTANRWWEERA